MINGFSPSRPLCFIPALTAATLTLSFLVAAPQSAYAQRRGGAPGTGGPVAGGPIEKIDLQVEALAKEMDASTTVARQIIALGNDKRQRNTAQRKMASDFIYAARIARGEEAAPGVPTFETGLVPDEKGRVPAVIRADTREPEIMADLRATIVKMGGEIVNDDQDALIVNVPLQQIEPLASRADVLAIQRFFEPRTQSNPSVVKRAKQMRERVMVPLSDSARQDLRNKRIASARAAFGGFRLPPVANTSGAASALLDGLVINAINYDGTDTGTLGEGIKTHNVGAAFSQYGVNGTGLRIGILSDSDTYLAQSQAALDLPPTDPNPTSTASTASTVFVAIDDTLTTPTPQDGPAGEAGEGTAMMEIVHDIAPGAKLFFASAFYSRDQFAKNIMILRFKYKCDIIIDDVFYSDEQAHSDDQVAQAVNRVTDDGCLYFSSAGNQGHVTTLSAFGASNSGNWEGDFISGGAATTPLTGAGTINQFNSGNLNPDSPAQTLPRNYNTLVHPADATYLYWSDKAVGATNDYDLYITNATGTTVTGGSTSNQNGAATSTPFEAANGAANSRAYIALYSGVACNLHLTTFGSSVYNKPGLAFTTNGQTFGHSAAAAAFGVAATPATNNQGYGGPNPSPFSSSSRSEYFSSDGPRSILWNVTGGPSITLAQQPTGYTLPISTPVFTQVGANLLRASATVRQSPVITAADGASNGTAVSGFYPFYGTSAAAPHAGAIAALVKSYSIANANGTTINGKLLSVSEMRTILTSSAIDIETAGYDPTTGFGIVMPAPAIAFVRSFCNPNSISTTATTQTTATITWTTNLPSTGTVQYGLFPSGTFNSVSEGAPTTSHSVTITNLTPGTAYRFRVNSVTPTASVTYADTSDRSFVTVPSSTQTGSPQISVRGATLTSRGASATVTLTNSGTGAASNVRITSAVLGSVNTTTIVPTTGISIGTNASANVTLTFPVQTAGTAQVLRINGVDDSGRTFAAAVRVTIPQ